MKNPLVRHIYGLLLLLSTFLSLDASGATSALTGVVVDSLTHEGLPYVAVFVEGKSAGTMTDENGRFSLAAKIPGDTLRFSMMGYSTKKVVASPVMTVELSPTGVTLNEVIVKPKKEKYSKKNNPAVDFLNRIRAASPLSDPKRHDYYNYDKYERINMAINDFDPDKNYSWIGKKFNFLKDHLDYSEISGRPILNFLTKEKSSEVNYRKKPETTRETVLGLKQVGLDEMTSNKDGTREALEDAFREIDIYQNDVTLLQNRFVSPLSSIAPDFYKFYLTDTVEVDGDSCVVLSFVPHTSETWGFIGKLYVPKNDSTMFIKQIELHLPHTINVNFLDAMSVRQKFEKAHDGSRFKKSDDMIIEFSVLPALPKLYTHRNTVYENHNFDRPGLEDQIFNGTPPEIILEGARDRDEAFWDNHRLVPLKKGEGSVEAMIQRLRSVPLYYWTEKTLKLLVMGYWHTGNPPKFDYGPVNTSISYNTAEGVRLRAGGMTTAYLSKRWFARGFVAYGFRDHKFKYRGEVEYSFRDKEYHSREFPVHSLRLTSLYLLDELGQNYTFTNADNLFLSWKRLADTRVTYRRATMLEYTLELYNNFSVSAGASFERQEATRWIPFTDGYGNNFGHYNELMFNVKLRYAPGEKFLQGTTHRSPINMDAPVIELMHTYAPKGVMGSMFTINRTEMRFFKRIWLSAFGYIDAVVKGGHSWSPSPYMNLCLPNANLSYTIQPESFALMNPLEFINDSYAQVDLTYWMNGLIFNHIPLIKKLKLREVINFKGLWGHLSHRNNPCYDKSLFVFPENVHTTLMSNVPYMEISAGIDNIFRIIRVDSVWRLSYKHSFDAPDWGIRFALHFSF